MVNQDFRDLFAEFNARHVDFLVVGAYALAVHGHVRATKDLDVWVRPHAENARSVFQALQAFGAPTGDLTEDDFAHPGLTFQIGVAPIRIVVCRPLMESNSTLLGQTRSKRNTAISVFT